MSNSIKKNYAYNLFYQILQVIVPFITIPYVSRVLGADNIGIYSYTSSVVSYFTLVAGFGISIWGQREVAYAQANCDERRRTGVFYEAIVIKALLSVLLLIVYAGFLAFEPSYSRAYAVQTLSIINVFFDISWFFQGIEEFHKIAIRDSIVKFLGLLATLLLVRTEDDLLKYIWIQVLTVLLGNLSLWIRFPRYLCRIQVSSIKPLERLRELTGFFVLQIAIRLNGFLDKTFLGALGNNSAESGYYEQAGKIVSLCQLFSRAFISVLVPRLAKAFSVGDKKLLIGHMENTCKWMTRFSCAIAVGLFAVSDELVYCFLGNGYEKAALLLKLYAPAVIFMPLSSLFGYLLVVTRHQKQNAIGVFSSAVINVILNSCLIKQYFSVGATIATVFAEIAGFCLHMYFGREYLKPLGIVKDICKYFMCAFAMGRIVSVLGKYFARIQMNTFAALCMQIGSGALAYFFLLFFVLRDKEVMRELKKIVEKFKSRKVL